MRDPRRRHPRTILLLLTAILVAVGLLSLVLGSTRLSLVDVSRALLGLGSWHDHLIILEMRLPRLVLSILVGAGLATSGAILQGVTRNDLASPDTVGVNAGSGLGMLLLLVLCPGIAGRIPLLVPLAAVLGAALVTTLVFALAYRQGSVLPSRLLLVGIAIGFGAHAAMLLLALRMSTTTYSYVVTWMSGTLAGGWSSILLLLPGPVLLLPLAFSRARVLDTFSLGDDVAASLGVAVERQRLLLLTMATLLTSMCVAIGGHLGFLGLAAPPLPRRLVGYQHHILLPASALLGAILLLLGDSLARHLFAPVEMPAGVFVGILGGVYFLYLLATTKG
jgi:iron complex transport system permease protein